MLAHVLQKPREYLLAHPEILPLKGTSLKGLEKNLGRRVKREPMAYILGEKEFYGRVFAVTPDVLIPRPESETIVDLLKEIIECRMSNVEFSELQIIDIGTGSGCLAITTKLEWPKAEVIAIDTSKKALEIAKKNAEIQNAEIVLLHGSLLEPILNSKFKIQNSIIIANLPYVAKEWEVSPETIYEPSGALFADDNGLGLIKQLISQTAQRLEKKGVLLLEADTRQHDEIIAYAAGYNLTCNRKKDFILELART